MAKEQIRFTFVVICEAGHPNGEHTVSDENELLARNVVTLNHLKNHICLISGCGKPLRYSFDSNPKPLPISS